MRLVVSFVVALACMVSACSSSGSNPTSSPTVASSTVTTAFNLTRDQGVTDETQKDIEEGLNIANEYLRTQFNWVAKGVEVRITSINDPNLGYGGVGALTINTGGSYWANAPSVARRGVAAHELFHVFQFSDRWVRTPAWIIEGTAEWFRYKATVIGPGYLTAEAVRNCHIIDAMTPHYGPLESYANSLPQGLPYSLLYVATDKLMEGKPLATLSRMISSFESAFGISEVDFYKEFAAYRQTWTRQANECVGYR